MLVKCLTCGKVYDLYLWPSCPICGDDNGFPPLEEKKDLPNPIDDLLEEKQSSYDPLHDPILDDPYNDF